MDLDKDKRTYRKAEMDKPISRSVGKAQDDANLDFAIVLKWIVRRTGVDGVLFSLVLWLNRFREHLLTWFYIFHAHASAIRIQTSIFVLLLLFNLVLFPASAYVYSLSAIWWIVSMQAFIALMHICCEVIPLFLSWRHSRRVEYQLILAFGEDRSVFLRVCKLGRLNSDQLQILQQVVERYVCIHCDYFNTLRLSVSDTPARDVPSTETTLLATVADPGQTVGSKPQPEFYGTNGAVLRDLAQLLFVYRSGSGMAWRMIPAVFDLYFNPTNPALIANTLQSFINKDNDRLRATSFLFEKISNSLGSKERFALSVLIPNESSSLTLVASSDVGVRSSAPPQPQCLTFYRLFYTSQESKSVAAFDEGKRQTLPRVEQSHETLDEEDDTAEDNDD